MSQIFVFVQAQQRNKSLSNASLPVSFQIVCILKVFVAEVADEGLSGRVWMNLNCLNGLMIVRLNGLQLGLSLELGRAADYRRGASNSCATYNGRRLTSAVQ